MHADTKCGGAFSNRQANGAEPEQAQFLTIQALSAGVFFLRPNLVPKVADIVRNMAVNGDNQTDNQFCNRYRIGPRHIADTNAFAGGMRLVDGVGAGAGAYHQSQRRARVNGGGVNFGAAHDQDFVVAERFA